MYKRQPLNLYAYKLSLLEQYGEGEGTRGTVGMPMCLSFYELFPFWHTLFTKLGFRVRRSAFSTRATYLAGQATIPSDTVCYPAKLAHGHVKELAEMPDVDAIFYPCMSYNCLLYTSAMRCFCLRRAAPLCSTSAPPAAARTFWP